MRRVFAFFLCMMWSLPAIASDSSKVVVSIKPLHSLVAGVMQGDEEPVLLVQGSASPHHFSLKPSQMVQLKKAEMIFYIDDSFEAFLPNILKATPTLKSVTMKDTPGITLYPQRENGIWHDEDTHDTHGGYDKHLWLAPKNAIAMTEFVAVKLAARYPEKAALYKRNAATQIVALKALDQEIAAKLKPVRQVPFVVFHDAYQYFERAYGLNAQAAVTISPEQLTSAKHLAALQKLLRQKGVRCVFNEPLSDEKVIRNMVRGVDVKSATLDPEAQSLKPGVGLYVELMRTLAAQVRECLGE